MSDELRLYLEYSELRSGGSLIDPEDRWSSREDQYIEVNFIKLYREPPNHRFFVDSIEVSNPKMMNLDRLYLAVVRYSTGDTFGRTNGAWHIVGVAPTHNIAEKMLKEALESSGYKPWEGYFERLEGTEIHELNVI